MSTNYGSHRTACAGKVCYRSKAEAKKALRHVQSIPRHLRRGNADDYAGLSVYRCTWCGGCHLGHDKRQPVVDGQVAA